ncbi:nucleotidyltransferase domain-containing protein [Frankia sp. CNm7]|uniref:Nucleotidyltransferase domain-containing protein n=1 Tax=Frankia nepalensis TaxID=1836974 RepID=A0A937RF47_9ACTN|nr:nucleotidyltransferase domain-containing protein [Frankia nepalensis]MBL7499760.1 nucleotidyltransferase domain-containing protein [Frankia nepalensis]MBL7512245.1 nucleotidyltransferase domain-containing protein [Frankia nepalensis]MBL7524095.1 nucleotidyltransferase domain-containing protein [Frankia nepalensis]MBL7629047.1 nucleotidyltransferase domain-containing protein [Frankia nepalensis]
MSATVARTEYGNRDLALAGEILRTVVGSGLHGIAIAGTDDHDEMGVFIEPPRHVLGMDGRFEHYVYRTQPEGARSGPGDTDLVIYSLRKYLRLATQGNPTALLPLYAPTDAILVRTPLGEELRALAPAILSQRAVRRFLGYLAGQRARIGGQAVPAGKGLTARRGGWARPELVARYGYDVKFASHALRLAFQGREVAAHGRLTLPMPDGERERVLRVKRGDVRNVTQVLDEIAVVETEITTLLDAGRTPLAPDPDLAAIGAWSADAHRRHWGWAAG